MRVLFVSISIFISSFALSFCNPALPNPKTNLVSFPLTFTSGEPIRLTDYKGKVVILDFRATWCEPCTKAVPVVNKWRRSVPEKDFVFLGVNSDEHEELKKIKTHIKSLSMEYPSVLDPEWKLTENYEVDGIPCLLVFNREGQLVYRQAGIDVTDLPGLLVRSKVWMQ